VVPTRAGYFTAAERHGVKELSLVKRYLGGQHEGLALLVNKPPAWSEVRCEN